MSAFETPLKLPRPPLSSAPNAPRSNDPHNKKVNGYKGVYVSNIERQPWHDPYGYLQARDTNVQLDDPVYIASYPQNYPRHISHLHDDGKFARITNTSVYYCQVDSVAYNLDTQILTTGSPILDQRDNKVIAINNCGGGCTRGFDGNSGVKMTKIIAFLRAKNLLPKDAVAGGLC
ncbi:hypothetical protein H310_02994 [Aphanomyces invadans]|uniref:Peptidase S1 domain-containing protein n=1 Tax=Aphanomyces invadans TaxID=157072 RepID=A0A024UKA5_9STRA|nr:hypothetical protein H310_02994 [Aphanomyces invadans]ETW06861.1 hypothetical protein H310_02994 [Aphanomyces invadans]|eukprot:XP_008864936.1 hypothetical protein H310_02994 [Aphanomyces invadans]